MTDPVAEAAAQLAAQQEPPTLVDTLVEGLHSLEAKVEHLIHPEAEQMTQQPAQEAGGAAVGESTTNAQTAATTPDSATAGSETDLPNAASAAGEPTAEPASASNAAGGDTMSPIGASSGEPLHVRIAAHLEAIYREVLDHVEAAPAAVMADTSTLKTHVGDILHRVHNGMQVTEGDLISKLEALYRML